MMLSNLVGLLPSGSLHASEVVEHETRVSKERLEVFLTASEAWWCRVEGVGQSLLTGKSIDP